MSDSESEGEQIRKLLKPDDPINYENKEETNSKQTLQKSQRYLDEENEDDLVFSDNNFLSEMIEKKIKFSKQNAQNKEATTLDLIDDTEEENTVRLFADSTTAVTLKNFDEQEYLRSRKKVPITKRKVEEDALSESQKLKNSVITSDNIAEEISNWTYRSKIPKIEYKVIKAVGYLREPENEFTKLAKKNNWSDAKISKTKYFNPSLHNVNNLA